MSATKFQVTNTGQEQLIDGSVSTPALTFLSDTDTGWYRSGTNTLDIATGGLHALQLDSSQNLNVFGNITMMTSGKQVLAINGTVAIPSYSFSSDLDTGIYWASSNEIRFATGGADAFWIESNSVQVVSGLVSTPAYTFISDPNTGMYDIAADTLGFATGGVEAVRIDSSQNVGIGGAPVTNGILTLTSTSKAFVLPRMTSTQEGAIGSPTAGMIVYNTTSNQIDYYTGSGWTNLSTGTGVTFPILAPNGTAAAPSYSFSGSSNTGVYSSGAALLDFSAGGVQTMDMSSTLITTTVPVALPTTGSNTVPQLQIGASNNGIFTGISNRLAFTCGGTTVVQIGSTFFQLLSGVQLITELATNQILFDHGGLGNITLNAPAAASARTYTIPDTGSITSNFVMTDGNQTINGTKTITSSIQFSAAVSPLEVIGGSGTGSLFINPSPTSSVTYNVPAVQTSGTVDFVMANGAQTINGVKSFGSNIVPTADNSISNGTAGLRWSDLYAVTVHSGDIALDNDWRITEGYKVGHPEEGVMILSPDGKKFKISMTEVA